MKTKMTTNPSTERKVATFLSVKDANKWLGKRDSIVILNLRVEYHLKQRSLVPRIMIRKIIIDYVSYPQSVNITYGITKIEYLNTRESIDLNPHVDRWINKNPHKEFVLCEKKTAKLHFFGNRAGHLFLIRDKFLILYKTEKDDCQSQSQNINLKSKENLL